ncbi:MAG TPA: alkaline phosphatase D family protein [Kofleriaceae bacterium]
MTIDRRDFLVGSGAAALLAACSRQLIKTTTPAVTHGVQIGDVQTGKALVWARASEPSRLIVEWDTTARFASPRRVAGPVVTPDSDHAATIAIDGLPDGETIAVRARFEREAARGASAWAAATFQTPRSDRFRVAWTGDTCGQGFGRNPEWGGLRGYAAIRAAEPALFVHSGDLIYADNPILPSQQLGERVWKNVSNERVARVAQTIEDYRARFEYNLDDDHVRALAAEVPIVAQWDDHETHNNWWPHQQLEDDRYTNRDASVISALAHRAMYEWTPLPPGTVYRTIHYGPLLDIIVMDCRSYRSPNVGGDAASDMLGAAQARWLVEALARSTARWKLVACDQPLSLVIPDGPDGSRREGFADGSPAQRGREVELGRVLSGLRAAGVKNAVWVTADVHYAAAHHYDPARATFRDFDPFWEFVAGPIHAGSFGPNALDPTFGPEQTFAWAPPTQNLAPWDGYNNFGTIDVTADALTVRIVDLDGAEKYKVEIPFSA